MKANFIKTLSAQPQDLTNELQVELLLNLKLMNLLNKSLRLEVLEEANGTQKLSVLSISSEKQSERSLIHPELK